MLAQCEAHWLVSRIPDEKVDEMRDELHQHLREATRDGKPVGSVVGDDVLAFAESWAGETRPPWPVGARLAEAGYVLAVMVAVSATVLHLVRRDTVVAVRWAEAVLLVVTVICCYVSVAHVRGAGRSWQTGWPAIVAASLLTVGVAWGPSLFTAEEGDRMIFAWPWYATVAAIATAAVLGRFRK